MRHEALDFEQSSSVANDRFAPKVDVSEGSFRPLEIFFPKTKFPPAGQELAGDGTQGPVGTASRLVALEEDRYAQCV